MPKPITTTAFFITVVLSLTLGCAESEPEAANRLLASSLPSEPLAFDIPPQLEPRQPGKPSIEERRAAARARYRAPVITEIPKGGPYEGFECYIPGRGPPPIPPHVRGLRARQRIEALERRIDEARKRITDPALQLELQDGVLKRFEALRRAMIKEGRYPGEAPHEQVEAPAALAKMRDLYASQDFAGVVGLRRVFLDSSDQSDADDTATDAMKSLADRAGRISSFLGQPLEIRVSPPAPGEDPVAIVNGKRYVEGQSIDDDGLIFIKAISNGEVTLGYR